MLFKRDEFLEKGLYSTKISFGKKIIFFGQHLYPSKKFPPILNFVCDRLYCLLWNAAVAMVNVTCYSF